MKPNRTNDFEWVYAKGNKEPLMRYRRLYRVRKDWKVSNYVFGNHIANAAGIVLTKIDQGTDQGKSNEPTGSTGSGDVRGAHDGLLRGPEAMEERDGAVGGLGRKRVQVKYSKFSDDGLPTTYQDYWTPGRNSMTLDTARLILTDRMDDLYMERKGWKVHTVVHATHTMAECGIELVVVDDDE